jgi:hypothetical protein
MTQLHFHVLSVILSTFWGEGDFMVFVIDPPNDPLNFNITINISFHYQNADQMNLCQKKNHLKVFKYG